MGDTGDRDAPGGDRQTPDRRRGGDDEASEDARERERHRLPVSGSIVRGRLPVLLLIATQIIGVRSPVDQQVQSLDPVGQLW